MLTSSTGMALSMSCRSDCTAVTDRMVSGDSVTAAMARWKRESACRCSAGWLADATSSWATVSSFRWSGRSSRDAAMWQAPGSTTRRNTSMSRSASLRGTSARAPRADGLLGR